MGSSKKKTSNSRMPPNSSQKSRSRDVAPELRGWNWHQPPLEPAYDVTLAVYEVPGKYCSTGRDVYEEIDPGISKDCYPTCPYRQYCK